MRSERLEMLRRKALAKGKIKGWDCDEFVFLNYKGWKKSAFIPTHIGRVGFRQEYVLSHETPVIDDGELIVGKYYDGPLSAEDAKEKDVLLEYGAQCAPVSRGQKTHKALD